MLQSFVLSEFYESFACLAGFHFFSICCVMAIIAALLVPLEGERACRFVTIGCCLKESKNRHFKAHRISCCPLLLVCVLTYIIPSYRDVNDFRANLLGE